MFFFLHSFILPHFVNVYQDTLARVWGRYERFKLTECEREVYFMFYTLLNVILHYPISESAVETNEEVESIGEVLHILF